MKPPRYLIMDGRAFNDVNSAEVLDTARTVKEAKKRAGVFGNMKKFQIAIVDSETNEVCWDLYERANP